MPQFLHHWVNYQKITPPTSKLATESVYFYLFIYMSNLYGCFKVTLGGLQQNIKQ